MGLTQCLCLHLSLGQEVNYAVQGCIAQTEVFYPSKGGAEQMAKEMEVPFLGRVPLDPLLSRAAEEGRSAFAESKGTGFMPSLPALQAIIKEILKVTEPGSDGIQNGSS